MGRVDVRVCRICAGYLEQYASVLREKELIVVKEEL